MYEDFKKLYYENEFLVGNGYDNPMDNSIAESYYHKCLFDMSFRQKLRSKWKVDKVIT